MGTATTSLSPAQQDFIRAQKMFFVATAPRSDQGHINLSPKGLDTFRILSPIQVVYADFTGSGIETIAHIKENRRLTIMFCAFEGRPNILRLYGTGRAIEPTDPNFPALQNLFTQSPLRSIITLDITRVTDSCGYGVPFFTYQGERDQLLNWCQKKTPEELAAYQLKKNSTSIDGLPGLNPQHAQ